MAHNNGNNNSILVTVLASAVAFGGGYLVGNSNMETDGAAPAKMSADIGGAAAPTFDGKASAGRGVANLAASPKLPIGDSYVMGDKDALVTIIEFSDFQCPYCSRVNPTIEQVKAKYGDKIALVFRHFPLSFHAEAPKASEAALCADDQGKFWEMHDALFADQQNLKVDGLRAKAEGLQLDMAAFNACLDSSKYAETVQRDLREGSAVGVSGTPAFFINGRFLSGAAPLENFTTIIDDELDRMGVSTESK
ncbi:MAG: DsbA family protein [Acidobacteriota bacterium]